jgi:hypothetical protein
MSSLRVRYYPPHLDSPLTEPAAKALVSDPTRVAQHNFYPFLHRRKGWTKFAKRGEEKSAVKRKERPIRFASRRDSYILAYYRQLLNPLYESALQRLRISQCVIGYRKLPSEQGKGGKCNIHFAKDAFLAIQELGNCYVFALDIHEFFENLDHQQIKELWWKLLGSPTQPNRNWKLPKDHFRVFKAVTDYSYIDVEAAYKKLGLIGEVTESSGRIAVKYRKTRKEFPPKISTAKEFKELLLPLRKRNEEPFGIPQGSPISDLLANLYMLNFDEKANNFAKSRGGKYFRYSDDLLIIIPEPISDCNGIVETFKNFLTTAAPRLQFKDAKTQIYRYRSIKGGGIQESENLSAKKRSGGLEYLGFRYDGKKVYLRNSTLSGIHRKITASAKTLARKHVNDNPSMNTDELKKTFNYDILIEKFGRVKDFDDSVRSYTRWTFWTYVRRSCQIFGKLGTPIQRQFGSYKQVARNKATAAIESARK